MLTDTDSESAAEQTPEAPRPATPAAAPSSPFTPTERDEAVLVHLRDSYKQIKFRDAVYYTHKDGKAKCIFYVGKDGEPFELRFCKPSDALKQKLVRKVRSFYLTDATTSEDAIKLIDQHADETFTA